MTTTVRIATYAADPPGCDSFHAQDPESFVLIPAIADSLAYVDIDGRIQPGLATRFERVDPVTLDLELREGVKFHNGETFDADSVVATLLTHIHPETRSFVGGGILSTLKGCEKQGSHTVRLTTHVPDAMFLNRLSLFAQIYPKSILENGGPQRLLEEPIGTGAYRLDRWTRGEEIVLARNETHWANKSTVDELVFPIVPHNEWIDLLSSGDIDIAINVGAHEAFRARGIAGLEVRERPGVVPHFFLLRNEGPLADRRVRRALNYALHKSLLIQVASHGAAVPQVGVTGEGRLGYTEHLARYFYDLELAKRLLEEAGWGKGFRLQGIITEASAGLYSVVREFLRRIDVELDAEIVPRGEWMRRVPVPRMMGQPGYQGDFTLSAFDDPISHTLFQHFMQLSDKAPFSALRHEDYNRRLFDALTTVDTAACDEKVRALEEFTADEALFLLTTRESVFSIARKGFDVPLPATGHFDYPCLWNLTAPADLPSRRPIPRRARGEDRDVQRLLDATSFPGNLYFPGGANELQNPALQALWKNIEHHELRWRQSSEEMIRLLVDQATAQVNLGNIARSTQQIGIVLLSQDGRFVFANDGYESVTRCVRGTPMSKVLWDEEGAPAWDAIRSLVERDGAFTGVTNMGRARDATRRVFVTVTPSRSELDTRTGYACTFTDYSAEEDRLRMKGEAQTAALVQKALIPRITNNPNIATYYRPASETGGDWFCVRDEPDRLTLMVGDVTGHGTAPALVTASVAGATTVLDIQNENPQRIFDQLNRVVLTTGFGQYQMTCLYMQIDKTSRRYRLASAAHPYPMFVSDGALSRARPQPSRLLGESSSGDPWPLHEGDLAHGTLALLYTDGLIENTNTGGQAFGTGRLIRALQRTAPEAPCDSVLDEIMGGAERFYGSAAADDDITLVLARVS